MALPHIFENDRRDQNFFGGNPAFDSPFYDPFGASFRDASFNGFDQEEDNRFFDDVFDNLPPFFNPNLGGDGGLGGGTTHAPPPGSSTGQGSSGNNKPKEKSVFDGLPEIFGKVGGIAGDVNDTIKDFEGILSFFVTGNEGRDKENATRLQQQLEASAVDIQTQLANGTISAEEATLRLQQIQAMAVAMMQSKSPAYSGGGALANRLISDILSNARGTLQTENVRPFDAERGFTGSGANQRDQLGSNIRSLLAGGASGLEGSPVGNSITPFDVGEAVPRAVGAEQDIFGDRDPVNTGGFDTNIADLFTRRGARNRRGF